MKRRFVATIECERLFPLCGFFPQMAQTLDMRRAMVAERRGPIRKRQAGVGTPARRLGVTQPRVSDLLRGKINLFALDTLVNMVVAAGLHVQMRVLEAA